MLLFLPRSRAETFTPWCPLIRLRCCVAPNAFEERRHFSPIRSSSRCLDVFLGWGIRRLPSFSSFLGFSRFCSFYTNGSRCSIFSSSSSSSLRPLGLRELSSAVRVTVFRTRAIRVNSPLSRSTGSDAPSVRILLNPHLRVGESNA